MAELTNYAVISDSIRVILVIPNSLTPLTFLIAEVSEFCKTTQHKNAPSYYKYFWRMNFKSVLIMALILN